MNKEIMDEEIKKTYEAIARQIVNSPLGQCVLVLGPELSVNKDGISYKSYFKSKLRHESKYYESENLFKFHDESDRLIMTENVINYYNNVGDPVLLEMISRIPFPLIINVCPDKAINRKFKKKYIDFTEGFFTKDSKAIFNNKIPVPSKDNPVVYNIFGTIDLEQSLILTHRKLYQTIEYLIQQNSLPDNIESYLKTANSFVFIGFKFDSWHYQLICHKLGINTINGEIKNNITSREDNENENVTSIMTGNFNIKFTSENPVQCLQKIITLCEEIDPDSLRQKNPNSDYSAFFSYGRKDDINNKRELVVDLIEKRINNRENASLLQLFRDRNDLIFGDSINTFMTHIGVGKIVIRVISHKYLTSIYCMIEAYRMKKYDDKDKRILTVVMNDADIHSSDSIKKYKDYWHGECVKILEDPTKLNSGNYDDYAYVYRYIDQFIFEIKDQVFLSLNYDDIKQDPITEELSIDKQKEDEFNQFIAQICEKMNEE